MESYNLPKVAVMVVTYNRKELLLECLSALFQQTYKNKIIYVIDNASTDNTFAAISDYINMGKLQYVNTGSNLGGAGGFNFGMNLISQTDCDYLWIMDDDTIPSENALMELIKATQILNDNFGFLSSYVAFTDGTYCRMNRQVLMEREWIEGYQYIKLGLLRIKRASFVSFLMKKEMVFQVGLPFKEFFIWGDDTEYSMRISTKYPCYFVGDSVVIHKTAQNIPVSAETFLAEKGDKLNRYYYNYRNLFYVSKKYEGIKGILRQLKQFITIQYLIISKGKTLKLKKIGIIWKAYFAGLFFNPKIEFPSKN